MCKGWRKVSSDNRFYLIVSFGNRVRITENRSKLCERRHCKELPVGFNHFDEDIHVDRV